MRSRLVLLAVFLFTGSGGCSGSSKPQPISQDLPQKQTTETPQPKTKMPDPE